MTLLDVLEAKQQRVYTPRNAYHFGQIYQQRLAVGIAKCTLNGCVVDQGLPPDATLLSVVNQPAEYAFNVLELTQKK